MNELRRMAYLDALGVDSYVSRAQLAGAAITRRLVIAKAPDSSKLATSAVSGLSNNEDLSVRPRSVQAEHANSSAHMGSGTIELSPPSDSVSRFSLTAIVAGDWLWLEELAGPLTTEQVKLVQLMAQALLLYQHASEDAAAPAVQPEVAQFDWPIHTNHQLDLGEEAARASVAGFVDRRLGQYGCRGLILLGQGCVRRMAALQNSIVTVSTVSSAEILINPSLKRQVWRDLLPLVGSS